MAAILPSLGKQQRTCCKYGNGHYILFALVVLALDRSTLSTTHTHTRDSLVGRDTETRTHIPLPERNEKYRKRGSRRESKERTCTGVIDQANGIARSFSRPSLELVAFSLSLPLTELNSLSLSLQPLLKSSATKFASLLFFLLFLSSLFYFVVGHCPFGFSSSLRTLAANVNHPAGIEKSKKK